MASNDVNSIEYLSLEITSSTTEAVKALKNLSDALDALITKTDSLEDAASKVASFGKSLSTLASGIKSTITASKNLSFTGTESEVRELDKVVNKLSKDTLTTFGIRGKKTVSEYRKAFSDMIREYQDTSDISQNFGKVKSLIEDNVHLYDKANEKYAEFSDEIDRLSKSGGKKIPLGFTFADLGGTDADDAKKILGRIFTETPGSGDDFENWASELAGQFKNITIQGGTASETIMNVVNAYKQGKKSFLDYETAVKYPESSGGTSGLTSEDAIFGDLNQVVKKMNQLKESISYGDTGNDAFRAIAESARELDNVDTASMMNVVNSISAVGSLDTNSVSKAAKAFSQFGNALSKIVLPENSANVGEFIRSVYAPLQEFEGMQLPDFKSLLTLQKALTGFNDSSFTAAQTNLKVIVPAIKDFAAEMVGIDFTGVSSLGEAIKTIAKLGHANIQKSIDNMPKLAAALEKLIEQLNALPAVNDKTLRLVEALGQLKIKGVDAGKELKAASGGLNLFGKSAHKAKKHTSNLVGVFIKARAAIYALRRAFNLLAGSVNLASDLIEVQNVVDVTFGNYSDHLQGIAENAIEAYGLSELTFKSVSSQFQAMGTAMGISNTQMREATDNLNKMGVSYGETTGAMGDMSTTLTELAADMASFYNKDIEDVQTAMTAVYTGQTRPLRQFGIDLTQATLKEWAMSQGLNSNVESMTQAEKTMLRYQYVLAHTTASQGDFVRTMDTWHNQTVILKEEFKALGVVIGNGLINALKPFVSAMNATMKNVIGFAENVVNALGKIFGWQMEITGGGLASDYLDDIADEAASIGDGLSSGVGDAAQSAKDLKDILLGIDELNVISPDTGSSSGSSGGSGSGSGSSGTSGSASAVSDFSASLKRTQGLYESEIDNLFDLGTYISTTLRDTLANIDWDKVYKGAENFGTGLAQFLNGLIRPDTFYGIGATVAGAINTALIGANGFLANFDAYNFGNSVVTGIAGFVDNIKVEELAKMLNLLGDKFWDALAGAIKAIGDNKELIAEKFGDFFSNIDVGTIKLIAAIGGIKFLLNGAPLAGAAFTKFVAGKIAAAIGVGGAGTVGAAAAAGGHGLLAGAGAALGAAALVISVPVGIALVANKMGFDLHIPEAIENSFDHVVEHIGVGTGKIEKDVDHTGNTVTTWLNNIFGLFNAGNNEVEKDTKQTFDANIKVIHDYRQNAYREMVGMQSDWNKNNKLSLEVTYPNVTADAQNRMNQIKEYWNKNKKLPNLEVLYNDFSSSFKVTVNDLQNWFNNHRNMGKITVETPTVQAISTGGNGYGTVYFKTTYTPMAYASGGYPTTGELFYAGEHGIAEIAGSVNGRTAVAGGAEITGIKKAVEAETAVLSSLLNRLVSLNAEIAAKDTTVSLNGRSVNKVLNKQRARAGYSFT